MKILLVSPLPPPNGGIASWTERFLEYSEQNNLACKVVNSAVIGDRISSFSERKHFFAEVKRTLCILKNYCATLRVFAPDIIHINTSCSPTGLLRDYACVLMTHRKSKIVVHCRCTVEDQLKVKKWAKNVFSRLAKRADMIFVLNDASIRSIRELAGKEAIKVPNFIRKDYVIKEKKSINDEVKRLVYTGHILHSKGVDEILSAAKMLPQKTFVLAGTISEEYAKRELPPNVIMTGNLDSRAVCEQLDKADVFLFPSYTEGFSNSLAEAMARGLPVITTKVGANEDMLEDRGGVYVPIGDANAIVKAVNLIERSEIRRYMSEWNVRKTENSYCIERVMHQITSLYKEVLQE